MTSNVRYCSDIFEIPCWNGDRVRVAFSKDCHDRETIAFVAHARPLNRCDIIDLMDKTVVARFGECIDRLSHPIQWLSDQGPQYTAIKTVEYARSWGFTPITTPAYSPESNGMAEAFVRRFKEDYVYTNDLWSAEYVLRQLQTWMDDYNYNHPHSGLNFMSPMEYREKQSNEVSV